MRTCLILLLFSSRLIGQNDFKSIDSTSFGLFQNEQWDALIEYSNSMKDQGIDYYNFNYRLAIAYFNTERYVNSKDYFLKLLKDSPENKDINTYLYWCYLYLGDAHQANYFSKKAEIKSKKLQSISGNVGLIKSSYPELVSNSQFAQVKLETLPLKQLAITPSWSYLSGGSYWGDFSQNQFYLGSSFLIQPRNKLIMNYQYINAAGNIDESYTTTYDPSGNNVKTMNYTNVGTFNQNNHVGYLGYQKSWKRWQVTTGFNFMDSELSSSIQSDSSGSINTSTGTLITNIPYNGGIKNELTNVRIYQPTIDFNYQAPYKKDGLILGSTLALPISNQNVNFSLSGWMYLKLTEKLSTTIFYHQNQSINAIEHQGELVNNGNDLLNNKYGFELNYNPNPFLKWNFTYNKLNKTEFFTQTDYQQSGYYIGFKYAFH